MKLLLELVNVANLKRISKIEIFDGNAIKNKSSKFNDFYLSLIAGDFRTDRDAAKGLYNTTPADDRYRQLKSRFRKRLLNTVFFLNANSPLKFKHEQAMADMYREWALVNILRLYDADQNVFMMCRQILNSARKFQSTNLQVQVLQLLTELASKEGNLKDFQDYTLQLHEAMEILTQEIEAENIYRRIRLRLHNNSNQPINQEEWDNWRQTVISLSEAYHSDRLQYLSFIVGAMQYLEEGNYEFVNLICQQADSAFKNADLIFSVEDRFHIRFLHLQSLYATDSIEEAMKLVDRSIRDMEEGSSQWLALLDMAFLLSLKANHYNYAFSILQRMLTHKRFSRWPGQIQDQWNLYRLAMYVILQWMPSSKSMLQSKLFANMDVQQTLDLPALYPKELRIYTIWTIILQILILFEHQYFRKSLVYIERLRQYTRRQLQHSKYNRTVAFIRCLQLLSRMNFDITQTRFDNKYYLSLLQSPHRYQGQVDQLEIIPYHILWGIIFERLKLQKFDPK